MPRPRRSDPTCACASQTDFAVRLFDRCTAFVPVFDVQLMRTRTVPVSRRPKINSPRALANLLGKLLEGADREHFICLLVDMKGRLIGMNTVSVGDLSSAVVHPREVFKPAILANAASILLAHNHPSGDPQPSPEDVALTKRLADAGQLLGIEVLDHVVLGEPGRFISMKEQGLYTAPAVFTLITATGVARGPCPPQPF